VGLKLSAKPAYVGGKGRQYDLHKSKRERKERRKKRVKKKHVDDKSNIKNRNFV
jgi:hypothetical protein